MSSQSSIQVDDDSAFSWEKQSPTNPFGRDRWPSRSCFLSSAIGATLGLGNFWRFPRLVQQCVGGEFLVAYISCVILIAMPLLCLEIGVGQALQVRDEKGEERMSPSCSTFAEAELGKVQIVFLLPPLS